MLRKGVHGSRSKDMFNRYLAGESSGKPRLSAWRYQSRCAIRHTALNPLLILHLLGLPRRVYTHRESRKVLLQRAVL